MTSNQTGQRDPGTQDLYDRYLLGELCDADAAMIDDQRHSNPEFNTEMAELQLTAALVEALAPEVLSSPSCEKPMASNYVESPLLLDDGATVLDPDRDIVRCADGLSAGELVSEFERTGWLLIRQIDEAHRSFRGPNSESVVMFPFDDDAWVGPKMQAKFRNLMQSTRGAG